MLITTSSPYPAYKPKPLRSLGEMRADILALERETDGLLAEIVGYQRMPK